METEFCKLHKQTLHSQEHVLAHGAMMLCLEGEADVQINFGHWHLQHDSFIIFYPGDIVVWGEVSDNFTVEVLRYSSQILRAASMNIEHEIYRGLRDDRVCGNEHLIQVVIKSMYNILRFYFHDSHTPSIDRIVSLQVQSFFIGFADYMRYNPQSPHIQESDTQRNQQLFAHFMQLLEENYKAGYEVSYYASMMNISRKYLGHVAREHTGLTAKHIINDYRVQQLILALTTTTQSIKEIAVDFHFPDQTAFTRYFKAHTGKSPKEYRKN